MADETDPSTHLCAVDDVQGMLNVMPLDEVRELYRTQVSKKWPKLPGVVAEMQTQLDDAIAAYRTTGCPYGDNFRGLARWTGYPGYTSKKEVAPDANTTVSSAADHTENQR